MSMLNIIINTYSLENATLFPNEKSKLPGTLAKLIVP